MLFIMERHCSARMDGGRGETITVILIAFPFPLLSLPSRISISLSSFLSNPSLPSLVWSDECIILLHVLAAGRGCYLSRCATGACNRPPLTNPNVKWAGNVTGP